MYPSYEAAVAHDALVRAALRSIAADHYGDEASPHADADATVAGEKLAHAARALVRAVDALPDEDQPIGWGESSAPVPFEETTSEEPVPAEDAGLSPHRVRIYSHKPAHAPEFWTNHPADCDALRYGEKCWLDELVSAERDMLVPWRGWPDTGFYFATPPAEGESSIRFESNNWED